MIGTKSNFIHQRSATIKIKKMQGSKPFEINVQIIIGFSEIKCEFIAIENFTRCMNMYSIAKTPFDKLNHEIEKAF